MKSMRYIYLITFLSVAVPILTAQNPPLEFDRVVFDFGTIDEQSEKVVCDFTLRNATNEPLVVIDVRANCGCTTFEYSQRPLLPEQSMAIRLIFNPENQVGRVARKVYLRTTAADTVLMLRGTVKPRPRAAAERCRLSLSDAIFLDYNSHDFGLIEHGTLPRSSFAIYNGSDRVAMLRLVPTIESGYLDLQYSVELQPHEERVIDFGYKVAENFYGTLNDVLSIDVNGKRSDVQLLISAVAIDARCHTATNRRPKIELSENFIKFGTLKRHSAERFADIEIRNVGTMPLYIRRIESQNGLVAIRFLGSTTIASGEKRRLRVGLSPQRMNYGAITDRVRVISDDSETPLRSIRISAIIEN